MGYFYFRTQVLNKAAHSAVASAAYRSGEKLYSERDGLTKNYKTRKVIPDNTILTPKHAPEWAKDRQRLWNEVEKVERQKNAQIVREIQVALPKELPNEVQKELLISFCKENFADNGMVADIAIHRDKKHNPHAHIMLTMRPFNEDGTWGNKRKKVIQEVNGISKKVSVHLTDWNEKETMIRWRENYAKLINEKMKEHNTGIEVSHKSYKDQGLEAIPTVRLSREAFQIEKEQMNRAKKNSIPYEPVTFYGSVNQEIREINHELKTLKELKNQQTISLDQFKKEKVYEQTSSRSRRILTNSEKEAIDAVAKRTKSFVDYNVAKNFVIELESGNWKKKIENDSLKILAQKNLLNKAHQAFKDDPKLVIRFGFNPMNFNEQMKDKIKEIKDLEKDHNLSYDNYNQMLNKAKLTLDLQKEFVRSEFSNLYENDHNFSTDKMYAAISEFKNNNRIVPVHEIDSLSINDVKQTRTMNEDLVKQTNSLSKSIFILDRAVNKQTNERLQHLKDRNLDKAYEASLKIEQYSLQKEKTEKEFIKNMQLIKSNIQKYYDMESAPSFSDEMLIRLQEKINSGNAQSLEKDAGNIVSEFKDQTQHSDNDNLPEMQLQKQYDQSLANGLIQALNDIKKANERKHENETNHNKQRKRNRGNSLDR